MGAPRHKETETPLPESGIDDLLATRRSLRSYSKRPVSRELVDSLLQATLTVPSARNRQPWVSWCLKAVKTNERTRAS